LQAVVVLRNEKVKAEKERESMKKKKGTAKNKRYLNAGASGGKAGGLEDVDITPLDVDEGFDDFM
jgi:pectate lyase